jgi:hypothetical protein
MLGLQKSPALQLNVGYNCLSFVAGLRLTGFHPTWRELRFFDDFFGVWQGISDWYCFSSEYWIQGRNQDLTRRSPYLSFNAY